MPHISTKYANLELERRFLLGGPPFRTPPQEGRSIEDFYLSETQMRLRKTIDLENQKVKCKLTQKLRLDPEDLSRQMVTTIYLEQKGFEELLSLATHKVSKIRYYLYQNEFKIAIDKVQLDHTIWLAEVEFKSESEMNEFELKLPFLQEVTNTISYSGFGLSKELDKTESI